MCGVLNPWVSCTKREFLALLINVSMYLWSSLLTLYVFHVTNEEVRAKIQQAIGPHEDLLTIVKRRKLQWLSLIHI